MKFKKIIIGSFLITLLFLICSNYASSEENNISVYELFFDHPGNHIFLSGKVENIYSYGFEVSINEKGCIVYYKKTLSKANLGDIAYILGTLDSPTEITAVKVMTIKEGSSNFVILRSLVGLIIFLLIFGSYWLFNLKSKEFIRRK